METVVVYQEAFIGWGVLALLIAGIAQGKNRSGLNWWLLGLIGGPITLIVLLIAHKLKFK